MEQSIKDILKTIDDAINNFQNNVPAVQKKMLTELLPLIKELEVSRGSILNNVNNLKLLGKIQNKLDELLINKSYKSDVQAFIDSYTQISKLNIEYFSQFNKKYKPAKTLPIIKELAIQQTINDLMGDGFKSGVTGQVRNILQQNITTGGSYAQFQEQLSDFVLGTKEREGVLQRYTKQITTDAINQYNAQYHDAIAQDLQFNWGRYVGSNLLTSREFCQKLTKKEWIHKSELDSIIKGFIDGDELKLSKSTKLPLGMIPGTNSGNFKVRRGGYNCGHQFFWVPDSAVPDEVKSRLLK